MADPTWNGSKVLVFGANSFIGAHLVARLKEQEVMIHTTYRTAIDPVQEQTEIWPVDITDGSAVTSLIKQIQPDYIFNLTGHVNGAREIEQVWPAFKTNLEGSLNIMMAAQGTSCRRIILIGSLDEHLEEGKPILPVSPYAASKIAAGAYARMFHSLYQLPVVVARPFMVYGPQQKDRNKLVPYTIQSVLNQQEAFFTNGARKADWVYVSDVVDALLRIAVSPGIDGASIEIGTGKLTSVKEVVQLIFRKLNSPVEPGFGLRPNRGTENEIAAAVKDTKEKTGWEAQVDLETGMEHTIHWYQQQYIHEQN